MILSVFLCTFVTVMSNAENQYILTIEPRNDKTAVLVNVDCVKYNNTVFEEIGTYIGYDYIPTPKTVLIEKGVYNQKIFEIVEISEKAFSHCLDLETIIIGKSVTKIHWNMYQCKSLLNIFVSSENRQYHDIDGVLFKENELIAFPQGRFGEYRIPYGTKRIGSHSFKSACIESIIIPDGVEEIGHNAFYECRKLKKIILPNSIKRVSPNYDIGHKPICQHFYLKGKNKRLTIQDITKLFPE